MTTADTIYLNGHILTMNKNDDIAAAIAVSGTSITAVGSNEDALRCAGPATKTVDLQGKTMLPGFIDPHSHVYNNALRIVTEANLNSPPIGAHKSIDDILRTLKKRAESTPAGKLIKGFGYDDTALTEKRRIDRRDLDQVTTSHPIIVRHITGHLHFLNSSALEMLGITKDTPNPPDGVYCRDENGEPTGVIEEHGNDLQKLLGQISPEEEQIAVRAAGELYMQKGVVLASTGATRTAREMDLLYEGVASGAFKIRVIFNFVTQFIADRGVYDYNDYFLKGSVKNFYDGSIQGYTGYLSQPYHVPYHGDTSYCGYAAMPKAELFQIVQDMHDRGEQVFVHCNGDQAIEDMLDACEAAQKKNPRPDPRHVVIHAQMAREDQLDRMQALGVIPSFFILHTYYWGDRHRDIFMGPERAARMSPLKSALRRNLPLTIHCDTPVVPQEPLRAIWSAVNRVSTSGKVIGAEQRIDVQSAIRAYTYNAAYQYFLESKTGSIEAGKWADLILLDRDPLSCPPMELKDIEVIETIVGGTSVYKK